MKKLWPIFFAFEKEKEDYLSSLQKKIGFIRLTQQCNYFDGHSMVS